VLFLNKRGKPQDPLEGKREKGFHRPKANQSEFFTRKSGGFPPFSKKKKRKKETSN
jgi:hypothetical protein